MITTQQYFRIEAAPEVIFDLLVDPTLTSAWLPKIKEVTMIPGEPLRKGLSGQFSYKLGPKRMEFGFTCYECDRPTLVSVGMTQGNTTTRSSYELTPMDKGTEIRYSFQAEYKGITRLLEPLLKLFKWMIIKNQRTEMKAFTDYVMKAK